MRRSLNLVSLLAVYTFITGPPDVGKRFGNDYFSTVNDFDDGLWTYSQHRFWTLVFFGGGGWGGGLKPHILGCQTHPVSVVQSIKRDTSKSLMMFVLTVVCIFISRRHSYPLESTLQS